MGAVERQVQRLEILKNLCLLADYSTNCILYRESIIENLSQFNPDFVNNQLLYLEEKGFLDCVNMNESTGEKHVLTARILSLGIDLVEKMETGQDTFNFEYFFSKTSMDIHINNNNHSSILLI